MIKSTLRKFYSSPNFVYGSTRTIVGGQNFTFGDLFINFLHTQALYPYSVTMQDFSDFG